MQLYDLISRSKEKDMTIRHSRSKPEKTQPETTTSKPLWTAAEIKEALGFDPDDPNVTVRFIPQDFGLRSGRVEDDQEAHTLAPERETLDVPLQVPFDREVKDLLDKAIRSADSLDAVNYSQAAYNSAQALWLLTKIARG